MPNGGPDRLTVWIPLTNATLDNGCLYVIPANVAKNLAQAFKDRETFLRPEVIALLHGCRALPALPGDILAWNFNLLHWGAMRRNVGSPPRIAVSLEFLNEDAAPLPHELPLLDATTIPSLDARRRLVAQAVVDFGAREAATRVLVPLAAHYLSTTAS
jgi:ectoine hydroxylase-related dioxygenase (phytanoyl-CoA dioxygenase family)